MSVIPFKESCEMANFIFRGGLYLSEMLAKGDLAERRASVAGGHSIPQFVHSPLQFLQRGLLKKRHRPGNESNRTVGLGVAERLLRLVSRMLSTDLSLYARRQLERLLR